MYEVTMPKLSDSMEIGKIIRWRVKTGDTVHEGDILAEIESDKATMELECFRDGVVAEILRGDGSEVNVGEVIARITPLAGAAPTAAPEATSGVRETSSAGPERVPAADARSGEPDAGRRVRISPYARKLAEAKGIDYSTIRGSGPGGRIIARDLEAVAGEKAATRAEPAATPSVPPASVAFPTDDLPALDVSAAEAEVADAPFRLRTQARRLIATSRSVPQFSVTVVADVTALRARKAEFKEKYGATMTHLVMRACLIALARHPAINRSYDRGKLILWKGVNLGLAVDTEEGLSVPVLRNAEALSFPDLVARTNELVERARAGALNAEDRKHASFTITNLGMFDVEHFVPIANWPSAVTLAVASARPALVVMGDAMRVSHVMRLTATCDHRAVDGATVSRFLASVCEALGNPDTLTAA